MTTSEINEIKDAIAIIHHLCDEDPLTGWKYEMMKAVLPLLERSLTLPEYSDCNVNNEDILSIARVINSKRPKTYTSSADILQDKGRKVDPSQIPDPNAVLEGRVREKVDKAIDKHLSKPTGGFLARENEWKELEAAAKKKAAKLSKSQIKTLKAQGRIKEKK